MAVYHSTIFCHLTYLYTTAYMPVKKLLRFLLFFSGGFNKILTACDISQQIDIRITQPADCMINH